MRVLILNAEKMSAEDIEKETPAARAEKEGFREGQDPDSEPRYRDRDDRPVEPRDEPEVQEEDLAERDEVEIDDAQESRPGTVADD